MREEVKRIIKLVQEGKLSAEDAAELIDAFAGPESAESRPEASPNGSAEAADPESGTPPPHPPRADGIKDPFKSFVETIEKIGKEASDSVNWQEVGRQVRESAKKGLDTVKAGLDEVAKGKANFGGWFGQHESREVTLPLSVPPGKTLRIENPLGDVKVVGGFDVGSVTANAKFRGATQEEARHKAQAYTLIIEESDHTIIIKQPDVVGLSVDLEVQVAEGVTAEIRSESGDVTILDTRAGARVNGRSGDVTLRGMNGPVEVSSLSGQVKVDDTSSATLTIENKSGDILLRKVSGNINVRSASGDVRLHECGGKAIAVESVSGDVRVDLVEPVTGSVNLRTVNGGTMLHVPDGNDCRVSISTIRGTVFCELPLVDEARTQQRITGKLGGGAGTIDVSAVNGNITLAMRSHAAV